MSARAAPTGFEPSLGQRPALAQPPTSSEPKPPLTLEQPRPAPSLFPTSSRAAPLPDFFPDPLPDFLPDPLSDPSFPDTLSLKSSQTLCRILAQTPSKNVTISFIELSQIEYFLARSGLTPFCLLPDFLPFRQASSSDQLRTKT